MPSRTLQIAVPLTFDLVVMSGRMMVFGGDNADAVYYVTWILSHANGL